jgi:hypothetical protein
METLLGDYTERWQFFLGLTLLSIVLFAKGGLAGLLDAVTGLVRGRRTAADEQEGGHD